VGDPTERFRSLIGDKKAGIGVVEFHGSI
jgi:hypothetical protein